MDKLITKHILIYRLHGDWNYGMKCYEQKYYTTLNEGIFGELILRI